MKTKARRDNKQKCLFDETGTSRASVPEKPFTVAEALEATVKETLKQLSIRLRDEAIKEKEDNP